ncbi:MAG: hypothetical protein GY895_03180 [Phycisphaera sp.]|nr:hypothetical protein [Phycisphaera sp.]
MSNPIFRSSWWMGWGLFLSCAWMSMIAVAAPGVLESGDPDPPESLDPPASRGVADAPPSQLVPSTQGWPRSISRDGGTIIVQAPRIDRWTDDTLTATFVAAVGFGDEGDVSGGEVGSFTITARVFQNSETSEATLYNVEVVSTAFGVGVAADRAGRLAKAVLPSNPVTMPLERLLARITADTVIDVPTSVTSSEAPRVVYRTEPTTLLQLPTPMRTRDYAPGIETVVGVPQPLFKVTVDGSVDWYLFDGSGWLTSADLMSEDWADVRELPAPIRDLPADARYDAFRTAIDAIDDAPVAVPRVAHVDGPAALVVVDGDPSWEPIPQTNLLRATNTTSDLLLDTDDGRYYLLSSGRWFTASEPAGDWERLAAADVPAGFRSIPADDGSASHVLASIPGTHESRAAIVRTQVPEIAAIDRKAASLDVVYDGAPRFQRIDGTSMQYAVNADVPVIRIQGRCHAVKDAVWFTAPRATGPWSVATSVPDEIYTIPSDHPLYPVTFVQVLLVDDDVVVCGYGAGYENVYVDGGTVVYGTGFWWPTWYWSSGYWSSWYWHHPPCWGWAHWYDPVSGRYVAARGWVGPGGSAAAYGWRNPSTGWRGAGYQASSPYAQWGRTVATNGSDWLRAGHVTNRRGTVGGVGTSNGTRVVAGNRTGGWKATGVHDGNRYVAGNGNVYRRGDDGWASYDNGEWVPVSRQPEARPGFDRTRSSLERQAAARQRATASDWNRSRPTTIARRTSTPSRRSSYGGRGTAGRSMGGRLGGRGGRGR